MLPLDFWGGEPSILLVGIDFGKSSCSVVGLDQTGKVAAHCRMRRETVFAIYAKTPCRTIATEGCNVGHHMGRASVAKGHAIRLMPPEYVSFYVQSQKNDERDAEASQTPPHRQQCDSSS
jgi:transposase